MNLPTELLRSFVAVADLSSFSAAAELMGRSQPAISLQIQRLEELLNAQLLQRTSRKLQLTERGKQLLHYARPMLDLNDDAVALFLKPPLAGEIKLGIPNEFTMSFLPDILGRFARAHPEVNLAVTCDLSKNLLKKLAAREFDVIVAIHEDRAPKGTPKIWNEDVVWIASPGSNNQQRDPLPLIVAPEGCVYRGRMLDSLDQAGKAWRIVYTSPNNGGIQAAVRAHIGITALCRSTVPEGVEILNDPQLPSLAAVEIGLHHKQTGLPEAALHLIDYISTRPVHPGAWSNPSSKTDTESD